MTPSPVTHTPILRTTLLWSAVATVLLAVVAAVIGLLVDGQNGLWSGLAGVLLAAVFLAITAVSILIANRWFGDAIYVQLFFAIVLGGWLVKLGLFLVVMITLRSAPWISPFVFFFSIVAGIILSLAIDVIVLLRMRLPYAGDQNLPTEVPEDLAPSSDSTD